MLRMTDMKSFIASASLYMCTFALLILTNESKTLTMVSNGDKNTPIPASQSEKSSIEDNYSYWYPTEEEYELAYAYHAPKWWGARARKNKRLSIAFIGGSQTAADWYVHPKVSLEKMLQTVLGVSWNVTTYNEGVPGKGPSVRLLKFEFLHVSEWPNIISLDHGINCGNGYMNVQCATQIDSEISSIKDRFIRKNLDPPYFMFIEYFRPDTVYGKSFPNDEGNLTVIKSNPNVTLLTPSDFKITQSSNRGSAPGAYMMELARFHQMPFISVKDAFYPSLTRFTATHPITNRYPFASKYSIINPFPFFSSLIIYIVLNDSEDKVHLNSKAIDIITEKILFPFFVSEMKPKKTDDLYINKTSPYDVEVHMFPFSNYRENLILCKYYTHCFSIVYT